MGKYAHGDQYRDRTTKSTFRKGGAKTLNPLLEKVEQNFVFILL
jgi:hypothetical protein